MAQKSIDLHTHTHCSDGSYSPRDLVRLAHEKSVNAIAVTDHDTMAGVEEALAAGEEFEVEVIPGVEISSFHDRGVLHILGYYIDARDESLQGFLQECINARNRRNPMIVQRLEELGYPLNMDEVVSLAGGEVINRPHFAQAMLNRGYVQTRQEAFDRFLGQGAPAYFAKEVFSPEEIVSFIHASGGLAVLAHPNLLNMNRLSETGAEIRRLHEQAGFDGIEAYHGDCILEYAQYYDALARELGLFTTGGSDFHGDGKHQSLGQTRCLDAIPYEFLDTMKQSLSRRQAIPNP
ncbi:MAG: PHP domain-containing protein [Candidatus Omnitrophica bacterium]|nr:PHP domain-containing protein [Candidatus Omnitrophota bacterium]